MHEALLSLVLIEIDLPGGTDDEDGGLFGGGEMRGKGLESGHRGFTLLVRRLLVRSEVEFLAHLLGALLPHDTREIDLVIAAFCIENGRTVAPFHLLEEFGHWRSILKFFVLH